jgi:hypothetical protein
MNKLGLSLTTSLTVPECELIARLEGMQLYQAVPTTALCQNGQQISLTTAAAVATPPYVAVQTLQPCITQTVCTAGLPPHHTTTSLRVEKVTRHVHSAARGHVDKRCKEHSISSNDENLSEIIWTNRKEFEKSSQQHRANVKH